jgi:Acyl-CoA synthetases (AMP-forming)/AMP-acid ligases II
MSLSAVVRDSALLLRRSSSVVDMLRWRAETDPHRVACTFLVDGDQDAQSLTYGDLHRQARVLAGYLIDQGATGERALLLYPSGIEFLIALYGCFYAGVVAVPLYPPKLNRHDPRCLEILRDSGASVALAPSAVVGELERAQRHSPELAALRWIALDEVPREDVHEESGRYPNVDAASLAYLQYTSGSTRAPKGVMVSHGNLLANICDIDRGFRHDDDSVSVSWLPHFHDMGLVYGLIAPLAVGFPCTFMPPASFLQRPVRWLRAISRVGATHSGGPNFAYELCVDRVTPEQKESLDLSRWAVAFNGAEPVRKDTLQKFADAFACCGFSERALCSAYGLAEATLKVTSASRGEGPTYFSASANELERGRIREAGDLDDEKSLVGCGRPEPETKVVIVHPETLIVCPDDEVGEIWVKSASVAKGYWNRQEESTSVFEAVPTGYDGPGRFLRTGDLGFLRNQQLFITGRIKDLIIIRGRNHYPHDIEYTAQNSHAALRFDSGAALSVEVDGEERLVIVQEIDRHHHGDAEEAVAAIRRAITDEHEIAPHSVVLVRQNGVPKTSSGKVQRSACARAFLDGTLPVIVAWKEQQVAIVENAEVIQSRTRDDIEAFLCQNLSSGLQIPLDAIDITQPFNSFGLDSLKAMELLAQLETWLGCRLSPTLFWNYPTVSDLSDHLAGATPEWSEGPGRA